VHLELRKVRFGGAGLFNGVCTSKQKTMFQNETRQVGARSALPRLNSRPLILRSARNFNHLGPGVARPQRGRSFARTATRRGAFRRRRERFHWKPVPCRRGRRVNVEFNFSSRRLRFVAHCVASQECRGQHTPCRQPCHDHRALNQNAAFSASRSTPSW
jgi:hypothetical protein